MSQGLDPLQGQPSGVLTAEDVKAMMSDDINLPPPRSSQPTQEQINAARVKRAKNKLEEEQRREAQNQRMFETLENTPGTASRANARARTAESQRAQAKIASLPRQGAQPSSPTVDSPTPSSEPEPAVQQPSPEVLNLKEQAEKLEALKAELAQQTADLEKAIEVASSPSEGSPTSPTSESSPVETPVADVQGEVVAEQLQPIEQGKGPEINTPPWWLEQVANEITYNQRNLPRTFRKLTLDQKNDLKHFQYPPQMWDQIVQVATQLLGTHDFVAGWVTVCCGCRRSFGVKSMTRFILTKALAHAVVIVAFGPPQQ